MFVVYRYNGGLVSMSIVDAIAETELEAERLAKKLECKVSEVAIELFGNSDWSSTEEE